MSGQLPGQMSGNGSGAGMNSNARVFTQVPNSSMLFHNGQSQDGGLAGDTRNYSMNPAYAAPGQQQAMFPSVANDAAMQQRIFGMLNEAGTNLTHVPVGIAAPGQSFTFQHARFALSGAELNHMLAQQGAAQTNALSNVLNHPGLNPIYRPDFYGLQPNRTSSSINGNGMMSAVNNGIAPLHFPLQTSTPGFIPNFTSVTAQRLPKMSNGGFASTSPPPAMYSSFSSTNGIWPQQFPGMASMVQNGDMGSSSSPSARATAQANMLRRSSKRNSVGMVEEEDAPGRKKRKKRDPTLPTPARFAWNFYFRDQYTKIRNSEPSEHNNVQRAFTEIGLDLGKKWKSLTKEEKEPYVKMAAQDKERYEREMLQRFSGTGGPVSSAGGSTGEPSSDGEGSEKVDDDDEKVGIVLHEVEVEDTRTESEKAKLGPMEGELVADVLIVDDDEVFLKIIRHKLVVGQKNPPRIVTATSAADAKRMIVNENKKFGTVLLDKDFGEGKEDGISSLQVIRENGYEGVIVGVTGSSDDKTKSQFSESGANNTFVKGSSNFYDDLLALVKLHSKNAQDIEKEENQPTTKQGAEALSKS